MQITSNTTGMPAGLTIGTDKEGRDWCVVVVKGTFLVRAGGTAVLAEKQQPLVFADVHYGDPAKTSIRYECDFARLKPQADVIVNGHAYAPGGKPATSVDATLELGTIRKTIRVFGDRVWEQAILRRFSPSRPAPFTKMPLVYERAFGGVDADKDGKRLACEMRNLVGVGFNAGLRAKVEGTPLPNLEDPGHPIKDHRDAPPPAGFGVVGRGWQPRIRFAGTYDKQWLDERFPFLPVDFDDRYFLSAPADQQVPHLKGGEQVRCFNMTPEGTFALTVPELDVPITYRFRDREQQVEPLLDTVLIEPDERRVLLTWRASVLVGRKLNALQEIRIGQPPRPVRLPNGKRRFESLAEMVVWEKSHKGS